MQNPTPFTVTAHESGSMTIEGKENVRAFGELVLFNALRFEVKTGMQMCRGRSAYALAKERYGFRGNKSSVLSQLHAHLSARGFPVHPIDA